MNISGSTLATAMALPGFLAVLLVYVSKRRMFIPSLAVNLLLGGFASFLFAFAIGRLVSPVVTAVAGSPESVRAAFANALLDAALPEELARLVTALSAIAMFHRVGKQDVILTCGMIGLGFALFENVLYSLTATSGAEILIGRAIPTISHAAVALIMGALLARAVSNGGQYRLRPLLLALSVPLLLHTLYDSGAFLFEIIELPDLPEDPAFVELRPLLVPLGTMLLTFGVGLVELFWGGRILIGLRKSSRHPEGPE